MPLLPQTPIYERGSSAQKKVKLASWVAGALAVLCVGYTAAAAIHEPLRSQPLSATLAAFWTIGAPLWFWYEYFFVYRSERGGLPDSFEHFKQGQQAAIAIWAGLAAVLGAFAASDFSKASSPRLDCRVQIIQKPQLREGSDFVIPSQDLRLKCSEA